MRGISKSFGANRVLDQVDLDLKPGEICALLGENGAGKSTLMNILGGVFLPDSGDILLDGKEVRFHGPNQAQEAGIAFIHQELSLANDLSVYENIFLGHELRRKGLLERKAMIRETLEIFRQLDIKLAPDETVSHLDASEKQIVEIARALLMNASVLIMDEPTAALNDIETQNIFRLMKALKVRGVGIIFISHKLREVMEICDRYIVLRGGCAVENGSVKDTTADRIVYAMVGHEIAHEEHIGYKLGEELLRVEGLTLEPYYRDISFRIMAGEVAGFTGLMGDGRSELFRTLFGDMTPQSGAMFWRGAAVNKLSIPKAMRIGIGYVPKDRKENGIIKDLSILDNASVTVFSRLTRFGLIRYPLQHRIFDRQRNDLRIKMESERDRITRLSGGNQQKVILARWLAAKPRLLILDQPTQGVDVASKEEIYDIILKLAAQGMAVAVLSNEANEIIRICGSATVMYHGNVQGVLKKEQMTEHEIMRFATGGR